MTLYEKLTYDAQVGKMPEVLKIYQEICWPALDAGGFDAKLVGYFVSDTGVLHQLVHLWQFDDDADRRAHWQRLFADGDFMRGAAQLRALLERQKVQLLTPTSWGPHP